MVRVPQNGKKLHHNNQSLKRRNICLSKGQILTSPTNGNSFEYLETAKDSNGERITALFRPGLVQPTPGVRTNNSRVPLRETSGGQNLDKNYCAADT